MKKGKVREQQVTINDQLTTVIRSQAPTPVPTSRHPQQIQSEVLMLLKQGQLNAAFQQVRDHCCVTEIIKVMASG